MLRRVSTNSEHHEQVLATNVDTVFVCLAVTTISPLLLDSLGSPSTAALSPLCSSPKSTARDRGGRLRGAELIDTHA